MGSYLNIQHFGYAEMLSNKCEIRRASGLMLKGKRTPGLQMLNV